MGTALVLGRRLTPGPARPVRRPEKRSTEAMGRKFSVGPVLSHGGRGSNRTAGRRGSTAENRDGKPTFGRAVLSAQTVVRPDRERPLECQEFSGGPSPPVTPWGQRPPTRPFLSGLQVESRCPRRRCGRPLKRITRRLNGQETARNKIPHQKRPHRTSAVASPTREEQPEIHRRKLAQRTL